MATVTVDERRFRRYEQEREQQERREREYLGIPVGGDSTNDLLRIAAAVTGTPSADHRLLQDRNHPRLELAVATTTPGQNDRPGLGRQRSSVVRVLQH